MNSPIKTIISGIVSSTLVMPIAYADIDVGKRVIKSEEIVNEMNSPVSSDDADKNTLTPGQMGETRGICRGLTASCAATKPTKPIKTLKPKDNSNTLLPIGSEDSPNPLCQDKAFSVEVLFDYKSDQLNPAAMEQLRPFGEALASDQLKGLSYRVEGHTDAIGGEQYNEELSQRRAESVRNYLKYQFNFTGKDIQAVGKGKSQLADPANPASEKNRRVRIVSLACR